MKNSRQSMILEIIEQEAVETQEQLLQILRDRGVESTQATISRDIKQLKLIKKPMGQGRYRYAVSEEKHIKFNIARKLKMILEESVIEIHAARNLVVLKTMPGLASGACSALDHMNPPGMLGSLAGDDTAFIVMKDDQSASDFRRDIQEILDKK